MWCMTYDGPRGYALTTLLYTLPTPVFSGVWYLRDVNGSAILQNSLRDIAFDSTITQSIPGPPSGSIWGIQDTTGNVYQWDIQGAGGGGAGNSFGRAVITAPAGAYFEGIALDNSRPTTLAPPAAGNWPNPQTSGTIMGLDTAGGPTQSMARTLAGLNVPQEVFAVGPIAGQGDWSIGMDYSAELVRSGNPCGICSGDLGSSAYRIDIQYPNATQNPPQPLVTPAPGTSAVDVEHCLPGTAPVTTYLLRSPTYVPTLIGGPGQPVLCTAYPNINDPAAFTSPLPVGTNVLTINSSIWGVPPLTSDARSVEYVQWIYMCGFGAPFSTTSNLKTSDACRIAWSNP
jgi:hypothetical protein